MYGKVVARKAPLPGPYAAPSDVVEEHEEDEEEVLEVDDSQEGGQEATDPACKVYVGGLNFKTDDDSLKEVFGSVGVVTFVKIMRESASGRSRGTAMVHFSSPEEAEGAIETLNAFELDGKQIVVDAWDSSGASAKRKRVNGNPTSGAGKICPYFPLGKCDKGVACKWIHAGGERGGGDGMDMCPYYPLGKCRMGADCRWSHGPAFGRFNINANAGGGGGAGAGGRVGGGGGKGGGGRPYYSMGPNVMAIAPRAVPPRAVPARATETKICPYFELGKCEKGSECKWVHSTGGGAGNILYTEGASGTKICPYFPLGTCDKGANCKWIHEGGSSNNTGSTKICPYFIQGKCDRGAVCRWLHP